MTSVCPIWPAGRLVSSRSSLSAAAFNVSLKSESGRKSLKSTDPDPEGVRRSVEVRALSFWWRIMTLPSVVTASVEADVVAHDRFFEPAYRVVGNVCGRGHGPNRFGGRVFSHRLRSSGRSCSNSLCITRTSHWPPASPESDAMHSLRSL